MVQSLLAVSIASQQLVCVCRVKGCRFVSMLLKTTLKTHAVCSVFVNYFLINCLKILVANYVGIYLLHMLFDYSDTQNGANNEFEVVCWYCSVSQLSVNISMQLSSCFKGMCCAKVLS